MTRSPASRSTPPKKRAVSIGLLGNAAEILPELVRRAKTGGIKPDIVTDQTSAHDLVNGYLPMGWTLQQWQDARVDGGLHAALRDAAAASWRCMCRRCSTSPRWASHRRLRQQHPPGRLDDRGVKNAFDFPGFVPAYIRPLFCRGKGRSAGSRLSIRRTLRRPMPR